jgi:hypothetical protein
LTATNDCVCPFTNEVAAQATLVRVRRIYFSDSRKAKKLRKFAWRAFSVGVSSSLEWYGKPTSQLDLQRRSYHAA